MNTAILAHALPHAVALAAIILGIAVCAALAMADPSLPGLQDANLTQALALPAAASTTVTSAGIDTGVTTNDAIQPGSPDWLLTVPALTTTQLPDTYTVTYSIEVSASSSMGTPTVLYPSVIVQTGAGGAGAAGSTYRFRLPSTIGSGMRYVGFKATTSASTGNCSASSATLQVLV